MYYYLRNMKKCVKTPCLAMLGKVRKKGLFYPDPDQKLRFILGQNHPGFVEKFSSFVGNMLTVQQTNRQADKQTNRQGPGEQKHLSFICTCVAIRLYFSVSLLSVCLQMSFQNWGERNSPDSRLFQRQDTFHLLWLSASSSSISSWMLSRVRDGPRPRSNDPPANTAHMKKLTVSQKPTWGMEPFGDLQKKAQA